MYSRWCHQHTHSTISKLSSSTLLFQKCWTSVYAILHTLAETCALRAGALKRVDQEVSEELIMYRTMLDLIKPKLVYLDLPLFMALLSDLFPGVEQPPTPAGALRNAIEADLVENNLQVLPRYASLLQTGTHKVMQYYE